MTLPDILRAAGWSMGHWEPGTAGTLPGQEYWTHPRHAGVRYALDAAIQNELTATSRRAGSVEAELRETAGELEKVRIDLSLIQKPLFSRRQLEAFRTEATALLERASSEIRAQIEGAAAEASHEDSQGLSFQNLIDLVLLPLLAIVTTPPSRPPPLCYEGDCAKMTGRARPCPAHDQPAAPTQADAAEAVGFGHLADALRQPASPEPDWEGMVAREMNCATAQPAAPEPSADSPSTIRKGREWQERAESAEAQLAAARTAAVIGLAATGDSRFAVLRALLTPGGGTGDGK